MDSIRIADGDFTITAGKDGLHADNEEEAEKGFLHIMEVADVPFNEISTAVSMLYSVSKSRSVNKSEVETASSSVADKVFLTLANGTQNTLSGGDSFIAIDENNIDAAIFSKDDLTLNGCFYFRKNLVVHLYHHWKKVYQKAPPLLW